MQPVLSQQLLLSCICGVIKRALTPQRPCLHLQDAVADQALREQGLLSWFLRKYLTAAGAERSSIEPDGFEELILSV
jgi:hypothetical protein